jgi:hypothetical protein
MLRTFLDQNGDIHHNQQCGLLAFGNTRPIWDEGVSNRNCGMLIAGPTCGCIIPFFRGAKNCAAAAEKELIPALKLPWTAGRTLGESEPIGAVLVHCFCVVHHIRKRLAKTASGIHPGENP